MLKINVLPLFVSALGLLPTLAAASPLSDASGFAEIVVEPTYLNTSSTSSGTPVDSQVSVEYTSSGASASTSVSLLGWGSSNSSGANSTYYEIQPYSTLTYSLEVNGPPDVTVPVDFTGMVSVNTSSFGRAIFQLSGLNSGVVLLNELCLGGCGNVNVEDGPTYTYIVNGLGATDPVSALSGTNLFSLVADLTTNEVYTVSLETDFSGSGGDSGQAAAGLSSIGIDPSASTGTGTGSDQSGGSPSSYTISVSQQIGGVDVPEPISLALFGPGLCGMLAVRSYRRYDAIRVANS